MYSFRMFYSNDLLSLRGGQLGIVWLLATSKDKAAAIKKKRSLVVQTDVGQMCKDLCRMIPVQGKSQSFSLRTSSFLIHGISIAHRVKVEELLRRCMMISSRIKICPKPDGLIDLAEDRCAPNLTNIPEMFENDIGRLEELDVIVDDIDVIGFRA